MARRSAPTAAAASLAASAILVSAPAFTGVDSLLVPDAGGEATSRGDERRILNTRVAGLSKAQLDLALRGEAFFNTSFIPSPSDATLRDGLGPLFNSANCRSCHNGLGRGRPPAEGEQPVALVLQISAPRDDGAWGDDPIYGPNFNPFVVPGVPPEGVARVRYTEINGQYADGLAWTLRQPDYALTDLRYGDLHPEVAISPRLAQPIIGMGLLDAVPDAVILANANEDGEVISGRPNWITSEDGARRLGRFGWKANQPDLQAQTAAALFAEMGITTSMHPRQNCTSVQTACLAAPHGGEPELADADLSALVFYQQVLAVPPRRHLDSPSVILGAGLFRAAQCDACHVPSLITGEVPGLPALSNQVIYPFTDLLLHDMGPGLADGRPDHEASGSEWRTPPLWGLGRAAELANAVFYLHDGRARSIEEAILWHGGEAAAARAQFMNWSAAERQALIEFLESP